MDFVKKNWQFRDIISENELNRIEDGIEESITKAEQADQKAQQAQQTANQTASDLAAHLNDIATLTQYGHVQHGIITATVLAEDWEGDEAPYTNTVSIPGVLATDNPIVDVIDIDGSVQDAWGTIFRVVTSDGLIIFYALEKPDVD